MRLVATVVLMLAIALGASAQSTVERGKYLVSVMDCHGCHTPFKNGAPDMTRMLMGHPQDIKITTAPVTPAGWGMVVADTSKAGATFVVASDDRTLVPYGRPTNVWRWWHWLGIALLGVPTLPYLALWLVMQFELLRGTPSLTLTEPVVRSAGSATRSAARAGRRAA